MTEAEIDEIMSVPQKLYTNDLKDANRGYWQITWKRRGITISKTEEGYYESHWDVTITTSPCQPQYSISFVLDTQYTTVPGLVDIWREVTKHMNLFTESILTTAGSYWCR